MRMRPFGSGRSFFSFGSARPFSAEIEGIAWRPKRSFFHRGHRSNSNSPAIFIYNLACARSLVASVGMGVSSRTPRGVRLGLLIGLSFHRAWWEVICFSKAQDTSQCESMRQMLSAATRDSATRSFRVGTALSQAINLLLLTGLHLSLENRNPSDSTRFVSTRNSAVDNCDCRQSSLMTVCGCCPLGGLSRGTMIFE